jgi:hypothetical protein
MLFHVVLRHDAAHCPGYHRELIPLWVDGISRKEEIAASVGVKLVGVYSAAPEHHEILIVEADSPGQIAGLVPQLYPTEMTEINVTAITPVEELLEMARQMTG